MPGTARKVWRFVEYEARFGAKKQCNGMVPQFFKWYINGWDGAGADVVRCINQLRRDKKFIWLQGAVVELLSQATNTDYAYQGYLLNSRKDPASSNEIGSMLGVDGRRALPVLNKLDKVGLLEQVLIGTVDFFKKDPDKKSLQPSRKSARGSAKGGKNSGGKPPPRAENGETPLKKKSAPLAPPEDEKCLSAFNEKCGEGEKEKPPALRSGASQEPMQSRKELLKSQFDAMLEGREVPTASRCADVPTKADGGGVDTGSLPGRPHVDSEASQRHTIKLHGYAPHRHDPDAMRLGEWLANLCGFDTPGHRRNREVGSFAAVWHQLLPLSPEAMSYVTQHLVSKAHMVRDGKKRPAWMNTVLRNRVIDWKRKGKKKAGVMAG